MSVEVMMSERLMAVVGGDENGRRLMRLWPKCAELSVVARLLLRLEQVAARQGVVAEGVVGLIVVVVAEALQNDWAAAVAAADASAVAAGVQENFAMVPSGAEESKRELVATKTAPERLQERLAEAAEEHEVAAAEVDTRFALFLLLLLLLLAAELPQQHLEEPPAKAHLHWNVEQQTLGPSQFARTRPPIRTPHQNRRPL